MEFDGFCMEKGHNRSGILLHHHIHCGTASFDTPSTSVLKYPSLQVRDKTLEIAKDGCDHLRKIW